MTLASVVLLLAAAVVSVFAQPQTPRIATDVENKEKPKEKETRTPAPPPRQQQNTRRVPRAAAPIDVTFKTDLPQSEIFLSRGKAGPMQLLGKTDADGKLTIPLPPGRHEITASRQGARILRQQIKVAHDSTNFSFDLALPRPPPKQDEQASATPTPEEVKPSEPEKPPVDYDQVVARFTGGKGDAPSADEWKEAHDQKAAALEKEPDNKRLEAQTLLAEGQSAYLRTDFPSAVAAFRKAVIASPDYAAAQYALGNAYLATNQPSKAFDAYGEAVRLDKDMAPAYKGAGDSLTRLGRTKEATFYFDRAKGLGQTLPTNTSLAKGRELKNRKRWADAVTEFEDVAAREPSAEVFIDIGDCYVGLEKSFSAAKAYQKATELDAKNALAYFKYAEVMFNEHEWASAMEAYERALALDTTSTSFNRKTARARADEAAKKLAQQNR
ncbi:MAG TPA: tetratricopeptide repeat protein [Pyrinomonadaceae bacterium]|nr:tetratricopeptide repeat protein [Pyrinomonadaceae bacterium]